MTRHPDLATIAPMSTAADSLWAALRARALRCATWVLGRAGIPLDHREDLAEETAQQATLDLLSAPGTAGELGELERAVWRTASRLIRERRRHAAALESDVTGPAAQPWEIADHRERWEKLRDLLPPPERSLFCRLAEGDAPRKGTGRIHLSALAHELGVSRRTLGRRLGRLAELMGDPPPPPRADSRHGAPDRR